MIDYVDAQAMIWKSKVLILFWIFCWNWHCVKSVRIRSYSGLHFPALGLNTERYSVLSGFSPNAGKKKDENNSKYGHFLGSVRMLPDAKSLNLFSLILPKWWCTKKRSFFRKESFAIHRKTPTMDFFTYSYNFTKKRTPSQVFRVLINFSELLYFCKIFLHECCCFTTACVSWLLWHLSFIGQNIEIYGW